MTTRQPATSPPVPALTESLAREIADAMPILVWTHDDNGFASYFNARWSDYTGLSYEETQRLGPASVVHPDDSADVAAKFAAARVSGQPFTSVYRLRGKDGSYRWHEAKVVPVRRTGDHVTLWVGAAADVDEKRRAADESKFLVDATNVLGTSLEVQKTLADVARLVVPGLADWCAIDLLREDGELERAAVAHVDSSKVKLAWELWELSPPKKEDTHGAFGVMRTKVPELISDVTDELIESLVTDARILEVVRGLGLRSSVCVPLAVRGRVLGALSLVTAESGKRYAERDVAFAEEVARRISIALDNARLYEDATRARASAEAVAADVLEQSREVEAELVKMRAELEASRAELAQVRAKSEGGTA